MAQVPRSPRPCQAIIWTLLVLLCGCALHQAHRLQRAYGDAHIRTRTVSSLAPTAIDYWSQVQPILAARCVVCHACYDAPCQLKLGSTEGLDRGASPDKVYDALRVRQADPTRLFEDADTTAQWRATNFHPVLNEREQTPAANREAGLMLQLLELKRAHPFVPGALLPPDIDLTLRREEKCPTVEELPRFIRKHPDWGMPYGLPGLSETEHAILTQWIEEGAVYVAAPERSYASTSDIAQWEALLNGDSPKDRLASRYIYEHLFLAHVYFEDATDGVAPQFYELVRFIHIPDAPRGASVFTMIHNVGHTNLSSPLAERDRLAPQEDTLTVTHGFVGAYPKAFFIVPRAQLTAFVDAIATLHDEAGYAALQTRFGVRRTDARFWETSDALHALYREASPIEAGIFDLSRIENR